MAITKDACKDNHKSDEDRQSPTIDQISLVSASASQKDLDIPSLEMENFGGYDTFDTLY
ncbi:MAG: hypothetical protein JRI26_13405 [Deltaproteobacteria bacterium]|nr:hypothetical protein [Deltaproteobacteria bacterium]